MSDKNNGPNAARIAASIGAARNIIKTVEATGKAMSPTQKAAIKQLIDEANLLKAIDDSATASNAPTTGLHVGSGGGKSLWQATLAAGARPERGKAASFQITPDGVGTKDLLEPGEADDILVRREGGILPLVELQRYIFPVFGAQNIDVSTGKVEVLRQDGRTIPVPSDVRKPFASTDPKAQVASHVTLESVEPEMLAVVTPDVPIAYWEKSELKSIIDTDAQRALRDALDDMVAEQLLGSPGSPAEATLIDSILRGAQVVQDAGFSPNTVAVSSNDAFDLATAKDLSDRYLLGEVPNMPTLRVSDFVSDGSPVVFDSGQVLDLYVGAMQVLVDAFTGMETNTVRARFEHPALAVIRQSDAAVVVGGLTSS